MTVMIILGILGPAVTALGPRALRIGLISSIQKIPADFEGTVYTQVMIARSSVWRVLVAFPF